MIPNPRSQSIIDVPERVHHHFSIEISQIEGVNEYLLLIINCYANIIEVLTETTSGGPVMFGKDFYFGKRLA